MISPTKQVFAFQGLKHCGSHVDNLGLGETARRWEWSNGTEFIGYSYFPEYWDKLARYTYNSEMRFRKMSFPFALHPEFPEFLVEWKAPITFEQPCDTCPGGKLETITQNTAVQKLIRQQ